MRKDLYLVYYCLYINTPQSVEYGSKDKVVNFEYKAIVDEIG
jgi:hypothetical protein